MESFSDTKGPVLPPDDIQWLGTGIGVAVGVGVTVAVGVGVTVGDGGAAGLGVGVGVARFKVFSKELRVIIAERPSGFRDTSHFYTMNPVTQSPFVPLSTHGCSV